MLRSGLRPVRGRRASFQLAEFSRWVAKMTFPHPSPKCRLSVHSCRPDFLAERQEWVDSCPCYFPYIESVPTSEFGATADVRQALGYDM